MADEKTTKFGPQFVGEPTPMWARWLFRIFFYSTSMATLGVGIFTNIDPGTKLQITQWVTFSNLAVHGFSKMFGIEVQNTSYGDASKPDNKS